MKKSLVILSITLVALLAISAFTVAGPISKIPYFPATHSHNDYLQPRPLFDALDSGMASIEADVFYIEIPFNDDKGTKRVMRNLYVAHTWASIEGTSPEWTTCGTLQARYLDPLRELYNDRGMIYPDAPLLLHVDFKTDVEKTWRLLQNILHDYPAGLFTRFDQANHKILPGAVTVYTSHEPDPEVLAEYPVLWSTVDGRFGDIYDPKVWESPDYLQKAWRIVIVSSNLRSYNDETKFWDFLVPKDEIVKEYSDRYPILSEDFWKVLRANEWELANKLVRANKIKVSDYLVGQMREVERLGEKYGNLMRFWAPPDAPYFWEIQAPLDHVVILTNQPKELANWLTGHGYRTVK